MCAESSGVKRPLRVDSPGSFSDFEDLGLRNVSGFDSSKRYSGVCLDTRVLKQGDLFLALSGSQVDGHQFISQAFEKGASAVIGEKPMNLNSEEYIQVDDAVAFLGSLAQKKRRQWAGTIVAISGSNGKTTVKDFVFQLLAKHQKILLSPGNWNNHLGLPLTLCALRSGHELCVLEMGMNHQGELAHLVQLAKPDYVCLTHIGTAHIGELGSYENIVAAKAELFRNSKPSAKLVVNQDHSDILSISKTLNREKIYYSTADETAEVYVKHEGDKLYLKYGRDNCSFSWQIPGAHNVTNLCASVAICYALNVKLEQLKAEFDGLSLPAMRMNVFSLSKKHRVIVDCYNASPDSMKVALKHLAEEFEHPMGAILGDMKELGEYSMAEHEHVGKLCAEIALDLLWCVGPESKFIVDAAKANGMDAQKVFWFENVDAALSSMAEHNFNEMNLLIKASRSMNLDKVWRALKSESEEGRQ